MKETSKWMRAANRLPLCPAAPKPLECMGEVNRTPVFVALRCREGRKTKSSHRRNGE